MVNALESDHLEQALELLHVSKASHREDDSDEIWPDRKAHLYALSSIMHSFAAFEGQVNRIAYGILREPQNPHFIPAEKRTYEFREMIARWDVGLAIDKKVEFLLGLRNTNQPADLLPNPRELVLLRNWIVHGKVYRTELLIERKGEEPNSGTLHLRADGEEWAPKVPALQISDARSALIS